MVLTICLIVFFIGLKNIFKRKVKGYIGEYKVSSVLNRLNKKKYFIFNDVKLPINGSTSQIDHVVVSKFGVFVIETKNYKGTIKGSEESKEWVQVLHDDKRSFYNPILQNKGHIYALQYLFKGFDLPYYSIIVFTDKAELKTKTSTAVIYPNQLIRLIKQYKTEKIEVDVVNHVVSRLKNTKLHLSKQLHHIRPKSNALKEKCPKCGHALIYRMGKFGKFKGCTNYPVCNFTKN